jgi:anti-sigma-K factor RskA
MQCKEVEVVLEREGFVPVPEAARAHLSGCSSCRSLIADLTEIVATAHLLPAEVEPPARVWTSLRSQLEEEGIIRSAATHSGWLNFSEFFRPRVWATAAVGLLIVAAAALQFQRPTTQPTEARAYENIYENTSLTLSNDEAHLPAMQRAKEQPQDELTREYLSGAYQQKAELISVMMERGGSEN